MPYQVQKNIILKAPTPYKFIASGFGLGHLSHQPRLCACLFAMLIAIGIKQLPLAQITLLLLIIAGTIIGAHSAQKFIRTTQKPSWIVVDEMVGTWVAMYFFSESLLLNLFAFSTYLLVSHLKPLVQISPNAPIRKRFGFIMLDDIAAGIFSNAIVYSILFLLVEK